MRSRSTLIIASVWLTSLFSASEATASDDKAKVAEFVLGSFRAGRERLVSGEFEVTFTGNAKGSGDRAVIAFKDGFEKMRFDRHLARPVGNSDIVYFVELPDRTLQAFENSRALVTSKSGESPTSTAGVFDVRTVGLLCFSALGSGIGHPHLGALMRFPTILEEVLNPKPHQLDMAGYQVDVSVSRAERINEREYIIEFTSRNSDLGEGTESIVFDSSRAFVPVRRSSRRLSQGNDASSVDLQLDEITWREYAGVWVPVECRSTSGTASLTMAFSWSNVNRDVPDERFLLSELTMDKFQIDTRTGNPIVTERPRSPTEPRASNRLGILLFGIGIAVLACVLFARHTWVRLRG